MNALELMIEIPTFYSDNTLSSLAHFTRNLLQPLPLHPPSENRQNQSLHNQLPSVFLSIFLKGRSSSVNFKREKKWSAWRSAQYGALSNEWVKTILPPFLTDHLQSSFNGLFQAGVSIHEQMIIFARHWILNAMNSELPESQRAREILRKGLLNRFQVRYLSTSLRS